MKIADTIVENSCCDPPPFVRGPIQFSELELELLLLGGVLSFLPFCFSDLATTLEYDSFFTVVSFYPTT